MNSLILAGCRNSETFAKSQEPAGNSGRLFRCCILKRMSSDTKESYRGPAEKFFLDEAGRAKVREMLGSDDELRKAYGAVYANGCFVAELDETLAAVGDWSAAAEAWFRATGREFDPLEMRLGDCVALGASPGNGETRAEAVRNALASHLQSAEAGKDPGALEEYGRFSENGYLVKAFMPVRPAQPRRWTVRAYEEAAVAAEGDPEPLREITLPMVHEPVFGADAADVAALEKRVGELMRELGKTDR